MENYKQRVSVRLSQKVLLTVEVKNAYTYRISLQRFGEVDPEGKYLGKIPIKSVDFTPIQWKQFTEVSSFINKAVQKKESVRRHIGYNMYVITSGEFIVFREFKYHAHLGKLKTTETTIAINHEQWRMLYELLPTMENTYLPESKEMRSCVNCEQGNLDCDICWPEGRMADWYGGMFEDLEDDDQPPRKKVKLNVGHNGQDETPPVVFPQVVDFTPMEKMARDFMRPRHLDFGSLNYSPFDAR